MPSLRKLRAAFSAILLTLMVTAYSADSGGAVPSASDGATTIGDYGIGAWPNCHNWQPPLRKGPCSGCVDDQTPNPDCPTCAISANNSIVDNTTLDYTHEAIDFSVAPLTPGGCASCGSAAPASSDIETRAALPTLTIRRLFRPQLVGLHSSFGPGGFWEYDGSIHFNADGTGTLFLPRNHTGLNLSLSGDHYANDLNAIRDVRLFTDAAATAPTTDPSAAAVAVLTAWEGWQETFELVPALGYGRPIRWSDRNGNAITIAYSYAATATVPNKALLWEVSTVTDAYGRAATFTYRATPLAGFYPVTRIDVPGGQHIDYRYNDPSFTGLAGVAFPDGSASTFTFRQDAVSQCQVYSFFDASAKPLERRRDVYLSRGTWMDPVTHELVTVSANRVRMVINGANEVRYLNWVVMTPQFRQQAYVYEGGHSLFRFITFLGSPVGADRALTWDLSQPPSTWQWQLEGAFRTNSNKYTIMRSDALGRVTSDAFDIPTGTRPLITYPDDSSVATTYNQFREPLHVTDELGRITAYTYDARGNLTAKTVALGTPVQATTHWRVNTRGQPTSMTDANGHTTNYGYDAIGQLISITEPADVAGGARAQWRFTYDAVGNRTSSIDPVGRTVATAYDARNRPTVKTYDDGSTETTTYGAGTEANLVISTTDRNNNLMTFTYDGEGREISRTVAAGTPDAGVTTTSYLPGTDLKATQTILGDTTTYAYDYANRLVDTTVFPTTARALTSTATLDAAGQRVISTDAYGRRTERAFDLRSRMVREAVELVPGALKTPSQLIAALPNPASAPWSFKDLGNPALHGSVSTSGGTVTIHGIGIDMWSDTEQFSLYDKTLVGDGSITAHVVSQDDTDPWAKAGVMIRNADVAESAYAALFVSPGYGVSVNDRAADGLDTTYEPVTPPSAGVQWIRLERHGTDIRSYTSVDGVTWTLGHQGTVGFGLNVRIGLFVLAHEATVPCTAVFDHISVERAATQSSAVVYALIQRDVRSLGRANVNVVVTDTAYDQAGETTAMTDGRGIITTFVYDQQGRRTSMTEASGTSDAATTTTSYDLVGNATRIRSPRQVLDATLGATAQAFTGRNLVSARTEAAGTPIAATTRTTYTLTKKPATRTDERGKITVFQYGVCCDRLIHVIDPTGATTTFGYDSFGNRTSITDPNGLTTVMDYDGRNRLKHSTNAAGEMTAYAYYDDASTLPAAAGLGLGVGADGSAATVTDPLAETRLEIRDGIGRVARRVDPLNHATTIRYDALVADTGVTLVETSTSDPLGHTTRARADALGRVRVTIDALGKRSTAVYDADGNATRTRDPNGIGQDCAYDDRNRRVGCTDTAGSTQSWQYDADGNLVQQIDALHATTAMTYDARERKTATTDRIGATTRFTYDPANNLVLIVDAQGGPTTYAYDARNLLITETFPSPTGGTRRYAYDPGRRLIQRTDQIGVRTIYGYDAANRLLTRAYTSSAGGTDTFAYDHAGRLTAAHSGRYANDVMRAYDAASRLTQEQLALDGLSFPIAYRYDAADRTIGMTYPSGAAIARTYTDRNQLSQVTLGGTLAARRTYDAGGRLVETDYGNHLVEQRSYEPGDNLPASIVTPGIASGPAVTSFGYSYDGDKRMLTQSDAALPASNQQFDYDAEGRLIDWHGGVSTQTWNLSLVGDWTSTTRDGITETRTHTPVHEIKTINGAAVLSDAKGNVVRQPSPLQNYKWDDENRLTNASGTGPAGAFTATYRYDALGRRIQKHVNGESTTWISAGAQEAVEIVGDPALAPWLDPHADLSPAVTGVGPHGSLLQQAGALHVDFRPDAVDAEDGWLPDAGGLISASTTQPAHGWNVTRPAIDRDYLDQTEWDTFVRMMPDATAGSWSIALANGSYPVMIVMGDATSRDQTNTITVNGVEIDDPTPAEPGPNGYEQGSFDGYLTQATVSNGKLTIAAVPGKSKDPKLCFVEIGPQGGAIDQATRDRLAKAVKTMTAATASRREKNSVAKEYVYGSYVDEPLMAAERHKHRYFHANRLYSIAAVTNMSGLVEERYRYDAYGQRTALTPAGAVATTTAIGNEWGFTGRRHDKETGLIYMRARYMSSSMGRFVNRDWLEYVDGMNLYRTYFIPGMLDPSGEHMVETFDTTVTIPVSGAPDMEADISYDLVVDTCEEGGDINIQNVRLTNDPFKNWRGLLNPAGLANAVGIKIGGLGSLKWLTISTYAKVTDVTKTKTDCTTLRRDDMGDTCCKSAHYVLLKAKVEIDADTNYLVAGVGLPFGLFNGTFRAPGLFKETGTVLATTTIREPGMCCCDK